MRACLKLIPYALGGRVNSRETREMIPVQSHYQAIADRLTKHLTNIPGSFVEKATTANALYVNYSGTDTNGFKEALSSFKEDDKTVALVEFLAET